MESGPDFLAFYLGFAILGVAAALIAGIVLRARRDASDGAPTEGPLRPDTLPTAESLGAIAWMRQGVRGVSQWLIGSAVSNGLLRTLDKGTFAVDSEGVSSGPAMDRFREQLLQCASLTPATIQKAAMTVAQEFSAGYEAALAASGMLRPPQTRWAIRGVVWTIGGAVLAVGMIRTARGLELRHPIALLVVEMWVTGIVTLLAGFLLAGAVNARGQAYLKWLESATGSLRAEVSSGQRLAGPEVELAIALVGLSLLVSVPAFSEYGPLLTVASSGSSCSSGGCGGGGCGGGGCGG